MRLGHHVARIVDRIVGIGHHRLSHHDGADLRILQIAALLGHALHHVALGQQSHHLAVLQHHQRTHAQAHQLGDGAFHRIGRFNAVDGVAFEGENFANQHGDLRGQLEGVRNNLMIERWRAAGYGLTSPASTWRRFSMPVNVSTSASAKSIAVPGPREVSTLPSCTTAVATTVTPGRPSSAPG